MIQMVLGLQKGGQGPEPPQILELAERWSERWPTGLHTSADASLTVIHGREILLRSLIQRMPEHFRQSRWQVVIILLVSMTLV